MDLKELSPNPENPRKISKERLRMLRKTLIEFGDLGAIVFNRETKHLVGGAQRTSVFEKGEITLEIKHKKPTRTGTVAEGFIVFEGERFKYREVAWDPIKEKAANIAANRGAGDWDKVKLADWLEQIGNLGFDLDLTLFDEDERKEFEVAHSVEGLTDPDTVPENVETRCKPGDLWQLGEHRLLCGDSTNVLDVERLMGGEKADMVFTDPPYNHAGEDKGVAASVSKAHADLMASDWDKGFSFLDVAGSIEAAIAKNATVYVCTSWHLAGEIWAWMKERSSHYSYCVWHKPNPMPSLMKRHWTWSSELICYATYGTHTFNFPEEGHASNVWTITKKSDGTHPTQKPIELMEHALSHSSNAGQGVLDLFLGSGSTLIACEKTGRRCFGMEIDPKYCDVILKRWEEFTGKKAKKAA